MYYTAMKNQAEFVNKKVPKIIKSLKNPGTARFSVGELWLSVLFIHFLYCYLNVLQFLFKTASGFTSNVYLIAVPNIFFCLLITTNVKFFGVILDVWYCYLNEFAVFIYKTASGFTSFSAIPLNCIRRIFFNPQSGSEDCFQWQH